MNSIIKKFSAVFLVMCLAVAVYWTVMMYNYESDSGTENIFSSSEMMIITIEMFIEYFNE